MDIRKRDITCLISVSRVFIYEMKNGKAEYSDIVINNPDGWPLAQSLAKYIRANYNGPFVQDLNYLEQYLQLPAVKECPSVWAVPDARKHTVPQT